MNGEKTWQKKMGKKSGIATLFKFHTNMCVIKERCSKLQGIMLEWFDTSSISVLPRSFDMLRMNEKKSLMVTLRLALLAQD